MRSYPALPFTDSDGDYRRQIPDDTGHRSPDVNEFNTSGLLRCNQSWAMPRCSGRTAESEATVSDSIACLVGVSHFLLGTRRFRRNTWLW